MRQNSLRFDRSAPAELLIEVTLRFDEAGLTLARLPGYNISHEMRHVIDADDLDDQLPAEILRPTPAEVSRMDECFTWVQHLPPLPDKLRILVLRRLVRSARTGSFRYSWKRLGDKLGVSNHTAKRWHEDAMALIAKKITEKQFSTSNTSKIQLVQTSC